MNPSPYDLNQLHNFQPRSAQLQVASPMNDIQLISLVASHLVPQALSEEAAVTRAIKVVALAVAWVEAGQLDREMTIAREALAQTNEP